MKRKIICITRAPYFRHLKGVAVPGCKKRVSITVAKLKEWDKKRVDELERVIMVYLVEGFNALEDRYATFDLNGSEWYLQGNGLKMTQMRELKKRFGNWFIEEVGDNLGKFLKMTPKQENPKPA